MEANHNAQLQEQSHQHKQVLEASVRQSTSIRKRHEAEIEALESTIEQLESRLSKAGKDHVQDLQIAHEEYSTKTQALEARLSRAEEKAKEAEQRLERLSKELDTERSAILELRTQTEEKLREWRFRLSWMIS